MGKIPCEIIISCGAPKSKAAALGLYPYELLKPIAREMFEFETELCDNAEILSANLTPADQALVIESAGKSWLFTLAMQKFMNDHAGQLTASRVDQDARDVTYFYVAMRAFLDEQMLFFHDLVGRYSSGP